MWNHFLSLIYQCIYLSQSQPIGVEGWMKTEISKDGFKADNCALAEIAQHSLLIYISFERVQISAFL